MDSGLLRRRRPAASSIPSKRAFRQLLLVARVSIGLRPVDARAALLARKLVPRQPWTGMGKPVFAPAQLAFL
jgi:hypothetical protein